MNASERLGGWLKQFPQQLSGVVAIDADKDRLYQFNLTKNNTALNPELVNDAAAFSQWVNKKLTEKGCRYGIGGYMELRTIYNNREQFTTNNEERRNLHLGVDIWGEAGTLVYAPLAGIVHSFRDNDNFGDYGPTIILQHDLAGFKLFSLYGHLSRESLKGLSVGKPVTAGQQLASFGTAAENGSWPPHLHFQLMLDMEGQEGDYPGACRLTDKEKYLMNIPDPGILLQLPVGMIVE